MAMKFRIKTTTSVSKAKSKAERLLSEGNRWVSFVISIDLWERFVTEICKDEKPSIVLTRMIESSVNEKSEGICQ